MYNAHQWTSLNYHLGSFASLFLPGALCALSGMLVTGLPIPIIANNFSLYYTVSKLKKRLDEREQLKRVTSTEVLSTMKNIMNKVNPLDKIKGLNAMDKLKGMNFNPVSKVKGLVGSNNKSHSGENSAAPSAHASQQGTPVVPQREGTEEPRALALPPIEHEGEEDEDVEAQRSMEQPSDRASAGGASASAAVPPIPYHLPPLTKVQPKRSGKRDEDSDA